MIKYNNPKSYMNNSEFAKAKELTRDINILASYLRGKGFKIDEIKANKVIQTMEKELEQLKNISFAKTILKIN